MPIMNLDTSYLIFFSLYCVAGFFQGESFFFFFFFFFADCHHLKHLLT